MAKIRVLVVDDAVVIRKILTDVLSEEQEIEVVGVAANGKIALQKISQCNPDIITLDVEMPEMGGLETVRRIRETNTTLPIIMFSTLTERGAEVTLEALSAGANDYVTKPANVGSVSAAREAVKRDLVSRIRQLARKTPLAQSPLPARPTGTSPRIQTAQPAGQIEMVTIGVSTGGPNALAELLPALPCDLGTPVTIVQHMPPLFTKLLAQRLDSQCKMRVREAEQGMPIEANKIYIAPGNFHLEVRRTKGFDAYLHQGPQENSCRPAVDPLFRSVVAACGARTLGVILTGMGQDGLRGCEAIKDVGGQVIAQDEATSVVWGMPGYVAQAGLADAILPISAIASEIVRRVRRGSATQASMATQQSGPPVVGPTKTDAS